VISRIGILNPLQRLIMVMCFIWAGSLQAQNITLNLKDADINALISTVAEITGSNFIVDPRVKGKVTVISSRPMNADEVYQVFLSILQVHGFAAVPSGEVIKIVPDVSAKQDRIPTVGDEDPGVGDEMVTRVVQVDNVAAAQLVPILRPLVPQQGHLAAYPATNVLIISDRAENVSRLVSIIRRIDTVSDSEVEIIRLQYASAAEVVRILTAVSRSDPGQPKAPGSAGTTTLIADERTNSVLLGGDRGERLRLRAIISHLDTPLERDGNTKVVYLKYAKAVDLVQVLQGVGQSQGEGAQGKPQAGASSDKQLDIQADEATNALVISAPPAMMMALESVIRQLDIRRSQVLIDAIIAEVGERKARELGLQWVVNGSSSAGSPIGGTSFNNVGTPATNIVSGVLSGNFPGLGNGLSMAGGSITDGGQINWGVIVQALASDSDTNVLSTPSLVTLDNEEAEIIVGQNVPFVTGSFTTSVSGGQSVDPFQTINREDVGITLRVKPQINEGDAIVLEIEQETSAISPSAAASDIITDKRSIKTKVLVEDGQVIVLGGLIEDRVTESEQKVPLLGDLPVLGALFRSTGTNRDKVNLMVFIRPSIIEDKKVADTYTSGKYNLMRAQQFELHEPGVPLLPGEEIPRLPEFDELLELPPPYQATPYEATPSEVLPGDDMSKE